MGIVKDEELKKLNKERHDLVRLYNSKQVDNTQYTNKMKILEERINIKVQELIQTLKPRRLENIEIKEEQIKMPDEKPKAAKPVKEAKPKKETNTDIILKILQMKSVKSIDEVVAKYKERKPTANVKNVRQQISEIIGWVKKGQGRFACYTWNQESFQLTEKNPQ